MQSQANTTRTAPRRAPRSARAQSRQVVDLHAVTWFDLFHDQDLAWPDGATPVETIAAAIRAAV